MPTDSFSRPTVIPRPWVAAGLVSSLVIGLLMALDSPAFALPEGCEQGGGGTASCSFTTVTDPISFVVPAGVTSLEVELKGGDGGSSPQATGGTGGLTKRPVDDVIPGETLGIFVGDLGESKPNPCQPSGGAGGVSGGEPSGGDGGPATNSACGGAGGGGGSFITRGMSLIPSKVLAAAGGGGGAAVGPTPTEEGFGGDGGGFTTAPDSGQPEGGGEGGDNEGMVGENGTAPQIPNTGGGGGGGGGYPRSGDGGDAAAGGGGGCGGTAHCPEDNQSQNLAGAYREAAPGYVLIFFQTGDAPAGPGGPSGRTPPADVPTEPNPNGGSHPSSNDPNPNTNPNSDPKPLEGMDPVNTDTALCKPEKKVCRVSVAGPDSAFTIDAQDGNETAILFATMNGNWRSASVEASGRPNCPDYTERNSDWAQFGFFESERGRTWHKTGYLTQRQKMKKAAAAAMAQKLQVCFAAPYKFPTRAGYRLGTQGPDRVGVLAECGTVRGKVPCVTARDILKVKGGWVVRLTFKVPANAKDPKALG